MVLEKIRNKNNLPIVLFFIIVINYLPLILPNLISKDSHGVQIIPMACCFGIQCILLGIVFWKNIFLTKEKINKIIISIFISLVLIVVQIINFMKNSNQILDCANIICQFVNITLLFVSVIDFKIEENYIIKFMKAIIFFGFVACIVNIIIYFKEILDLICGGSKTNYIKSFFANRNQFAFFLYVSIIENVFVIVGENKKFYKLTFVLFLANLFFSLSRTGIVVTVMFLALLFIYMNKVNRKTKIIYLTIAIIFGIILVLVLYYLNPELINKFFRISSLKNLSGRTTIWENGVKLLLENPFNILFGVGRFKGNDVLHIKDKSFTQFHNIYLDFLITGGILELSFVIYIYSYIIRKIKESNIDIKYKKIYKTVFITYFIYAFFESVGRFSIGAVDTLCFIFFITIPLLHANGVVKNK